MKIYKSNKACRGVASSLSFNTKEQSFFLQLVKQTGYDEARHIGSFKNGDKITIKLSLWEIGGLLKLFNTNKESSYFHKTENSNVSIKFSPYIVQATNEQKGYGISVTKMGEPNITWLLPINFDESEVIKVYLNMALSRCFEVEHVNESKLFKQKQQENQDTNKPVANDIEEQVI